MKKTIAAVLALALVLTAIPTAAFAQDEETTPGDISSATIEAIEDKTFTGEPITLTEEELVVKDGDTVLVPDTDYTTEYENNINAGQASVTVTGKGDYAGTVSANFTINPVDFSGDDFPDIDIPHQSVRPGDNSVLGTTVVWKGIQLVENTDYTVTGNNDTAGMHRATFTFLGNYTGETSGFYYVFKGSLNDGELNVQLPENGYTYDGKAKEPTVSVTLDGEVLKPITDYRVSYENNVDAGTATVKVIGVSDYNGEITKTFTINKAKGSLTTTYTTYSKTTDSKVFSLNPKTSTDATGFTFTTSNSKVAKVSASGKVTVTGTGRATITVKTVGSKNYTQAEKKITVKVAPKTPTIKLSSPKRGRVSVQIHKVSGATKYQVRYGRMGKYYNKYVTHKNDGKKTVTVNIDKRRAKTKYYVKVRAYKKLSDGTIIWGKWTTLKSVRAK